MKHEFDEITKNCKTSFNKGGKKVNKIYILSNVFGISIFVKVLRYFVFLKWVRLFTIMHVHIDVKFMIKRISYGKERQKGMEIFRCHYFIAYIISTNIANINIPIIFYCILKI